MNLTHINNEGTAIALINQGFTIYAESARGVVPVVKNGVVVSQKGNNLGTGRFYDPTEHRTAIPPANIVTKLPVEN